MKPAKARAKAPERRLVVLESLGRAEEEGRWWGNDGECEGEVEVRAAAC